MIKEEIKKSFLCKTISLLPYLVGGKHSTVKFPYKIILYKFLHNKQTIENFCKKYQNSFLNIETNFYKIIYFYSKIYYTKYSRVSTII